MRHDNGEVKIRLLIAQSLAAVQIIIFILMVYYVYLDQTTGQWAFLGGIFYSLVLFIFSAACLIFSFIFLRSDYKVWAYSFILFSSLLLTPYTSIPLARFFAQPMVYVHFHASAIKKEYRNFTKEQKMLQDYNKLLKEFTAPQRIVQVRGRYILLENGKVIDILYPCNFGIPDREKMQIEEFINSAIIDRNRLVVLRLPESSEFVKYYRNNAYLSNLFVGQDKEFGVIPALVYLDKILLNLHFSISGGYREQAFSLMKYK